MVWTNILFLRCETMAYDLTAIATTEIKSKTLKKFPASVHNVQSSNRAESMEVGIGAMKGLHGKV
jgi:hypothetical protein